MRQRTFVPIRGKGVALCLILSSALVGCGGNDAATPPADDAQTETATAGDEAGGTEEFTAQPPETAAGTPPAAGDATEPETVAVGEANVYLGVLLDAMAAPLLEAAQSNLVTVIGATGGAVASMGPSGDEAPAGDAESTDGAEQGEAAADDAPGS